MEVVAMPQWPIRVKLIAGLTLVVGMMLTLMGGSIFGLHAFHTSILKHVDSLHELGTSKELLQVVVRLENAGTVTSDEDRRDLQQKVLEAQRALLAYHTELTKNTSKGNRADDGRDELALAFLIDSDLSAILAELNPGTVAEPKLPRTVTYLSRHPEAQPE